MHIAAQLAQDLQQKEENKKNTKFVDTAATRSRRLHVEQVLSYEDKVRTDDTSL